MSRIVVIDADNDLLSEVKLLLRRKGFGVSLFSNWEIAIKNIRENKPHLVLLDVFLGSFDGLEVCKKLKSNLSTRNIPVLIFSGFPKVEETAIYEFGANGFIAKPFTGKDLVNKIDNMILRHIQLV